MLVLIGEALIFGEELAQRSFPSFEEPTSTTAFGGFIEGVVGTVQLIWGGVVFFFNLITFNIPDAPWSIRLALSSILGGSLIWSIATLIRGN